MRPVFSKTRVFITVMTYPHPSAKHKELVCTAGVTAEGEWVRLYPVPFRYLRPEKRFHKYQWIELGLAPRGAATDRRRESREPDVESIRLIGEPLGTDGNWAERRRIIDSLPHQTRDELRVLYERDGVSLGVVRPTQIIDLKVAEDKAVWKPKWQKTLMQLDLFSGRPKALRKLPYKFSYVFRCEDSTKPHSAMIEDWELGVLFLKEAERLGSDSAAARSVRNKYLNEVCSPSRDTRFFMGTVFPYNTWVVIGVFWPPRSFQPRLF